MAKSTFVTVLVGLLMSTGLGVTSQAGSQQEAAQAAAFVKRIPAEARKVQNPKEATEKSVDYGGLLFSSQCTMCHGKAGDGKGDLAERLGMAIPDFRTTDWQKSRVDGELFWVVTNGHGRMPAQEDRFDDSTKWDIINYIRSLATP